MFKKKAEKTPEEISRLKERKEMRTAILLAVTQGLGIGAIVYGAAYFGTAAVLTKFCRELTSEWTRPPQSKIETPTE